MLTLRQMKSRIFQPIPLITWALTSILAGVSGPFRSSLALTQPYLTIYWSVISAGSIVLGLLTVLFFNDQNYPRDPRLRALVTAIVFSTFNCGFVVAITRIAMPDYFDLAPPAWGLFLISAAILLFVLLIKY
jgi:hypothetical protein